jgi:photosystem II stability/assembly factor-like uncharacterized protein
MRILRLLLLATPALLSAQTPAPSLYSGLQWRSIGPNRGGRSLAIDGSVARPNEYYFGAVGGGLWKTSDGGTSWRPVTDGQIKSASVGAVAVAPSNPDVVYIGMGEVQLRGNILQGDGIYRSGDGGRTWQHRGLAPTQAIARVRVHPTNPDLVYVAALGHPFGPNQERGVYRSRDGGANWEQILFRSDSAGAVDLAMDPKNPAVLYASFWQVYRTPWKLWSGGRWSGLFKSTDGGTSWTDITRNPGLPTGMLGRIGITVSPVDGNRLYAIVEAEDGGVFVSDDAGATWRRGNAERKLRQRAFYYSRLVADPQVKDRVYVLNVGLWRSDDGGATFPTQVRVAHSDNHDLWIAPNDNQRLANANDGGGAVSVSGGASWTAQNFPTAQPYHVVTTKDVPYHVCGAQQDNTTFCMPSGVTPQTPPRGGLGDWFYQVGGGESGYIAPDPRDPNVFYAGSQGALLTRFDRSIGSVRDVQVYPRFFSGEPAYSLPERWQWTYPIVFSPVAPTWLMVGSQHIWRSKNGGQFWERISDNLTRAEPSTLGLSGGPITMDMNGPEIYGTVFTIAPSRRDSLTIWAGSDDGLVHITRNGGKLWTNITPPDLPPFARISLIDASPHDNGSAVLAAKRYQLDDRAPYLYKTRDYGKTWTKIVTGLAADEITHAVREDPVRRGLLFAGTERGVAVSFDDGANWRSLSNNLPVTPVVDLVVEGADLVIASHGRGMWILPSIDPLRASTAATAGKAAHVFTPQVAVRRVSTARIQYYLAADVEQLTLRIRDSAGVVVRSWVGRRTPPAPLASSVPGCERGPVLPGNPPTKAGLNEWEWDLRYEGALTFDCMIIWGARPEQGPIAMPGRYTVELEAAGVVERQPLRIVRDLRNTEVDDSDLRAQFVFALRTLEQEDRTNGAVIRLRNWRAAVEQRRAQTQDAAALALTDTVLTGLLDVEEQLYQWRNRSGQDPLNYPIRLGNRIHALRRSVETGDARPTDVAYIVLRGLTDDLDKELAKLSAVEKGALSRLDGRLSALGLTPVVPPSTGR